MVMNLHTEQIIANTMKRMSELEIENKKLKEKVSWHESNDAFVVKGLKAQKNIITTLEEECAALRSQLNELL